MITVKITGIPAVSAVWRGYPYVVQYYIRSVAQYIAKEAKKYIPVSMRRIHPKSKRKMADSTRLGKSMRVLKFVGAGVNSVAYIGSDVEHAKFFTLGTSGHFIEARRAQVLTIFKPGARDADQYGFIHRKWAKHPGNSGSMWRQYAWRDVTKPMMQKAWSRALMLASKRYGRQGEAFELGLFDATVGGLEQAPNE